MTGARELSVWQLVEAAAQSHGDAPALLAPAREPLTYAGLAEQTLRLACGLREAGIGPSDRVAVVLPNGPDMAAAFVGVAAAAACAPLNPSHTRQDFEFYLSDLCAKALLWEEGAPSQAPEAARALGIQVITLRQRARAGEFDLPRSGPAGDPGRPGPGHVALLLHTSGTTSRPKLVPLSAASLTASAAHIADTLALGPSDRCLNILPLFHIHGLMAAVLASVRAGASVVCTDGFYASGFFEWMRRFQPSWYTAVPTMHQGILGRAGEHAEVIRQVPLRFIRSSSAPLPPSVLAELEQVFGAPVIEAYGMTEGAHQIASNPLPPARRKPGSVGLAAGPEVAIMGESGQLLPPGQTGEVVIRGRNVTSGYEANESANHAAFANGWLRTGDQGWQDSEGYLYLTGRLKELINRGGEKISPREIDEVLLAHPAVRQAVAFAVGHAQLGEEVAVAVEMKPGCSDTAGELRRWAGERLAAFKVPRLVRIVDSIPRGPTGKLQRIGLAEKLGIEPLDDRRLGAYVAPRTPLEQRIADTWRELLPGARAGVTDRFEALGGDSLLAVKMLAAVSAAEGVEVPYLRFVEEGTIAALAEEIESGADLEAGPITALQPLGDRPPLVCVPGHDSILLGLARLAAGLSKQQPVWAFDLGKLEPASCIPELARICVSHLRRRQPHGPYRLAGACFGGVVAFEMARLLEEQGQAVEFLALIDALNPAWKRQQSMITILNARRRQWRFKWRYHRQALGGMSAGSGLRYLAARGRLFLQHHGELMAARLGLKSSQGVKNRRLTLSFSPGTWRGDALVIRVAGLRLDAPWLGWRDLMHGRLELVELPFDPHGALGEASARRVAAILRERLD
ncbi:MAG: AMP-binding protein [Acidobacteria bacterium]|nr:AMP-binding protein [Acidobacteriota bacterium]